MYSYFFTGKDGVVADVFGRSSGKGKLLIMVHAITKEGPLVSKNRDEFPIPEGLFMPAVGGKKHKQSNSEVVVRQRRSFSGKQNTGRETTTTP